MIASRIAEIRTENNERSRICRDEVFTFLAALIRTGAGGIRASDKLCQSLVGKTFSLIYPRAEISGFRQGCLGQK